MVEGLLDLAILGILAVGLIWGLLTWAYPRWMFMRHGVTIADPENTPTSLFDERTWYSKEKIERSNLGPDPASTSAPTEDLLNTPESQPFRWLIDLPRPRHVMKRSRWRYSLLPVLPVLMWLAALWDGDLNSSLTFICGSLTVIGSVVFLLNPGGSVRLLATGNVALGKVVAFEWAGNVEADLGWNIDYWFWDSGGNAYAETYEYANQQEWQGQIGDLLPVIYDNSDPSRHQLLFDLDRIVRAESSRSERFPSRSVVRRWRCESSLDASPVFLCS